jgi:hypothetical protein
LPAQPKEEKLSEGIDEGVSAQVVIVSAKRTKQECSVKTVV